MSEESFSKSASSDNSRMIKNLNVTKEEIVYDDIMRDQRIEHGNQMVKREMNEASNALYNAYDFETKTHQSPSYEAQKYLSKEDVYQIFKV